MPKGISNRWATAYVTEPIELGKAGIKVVIWDKWGKTRRGTAIISVGGIRWYSYKAKKATAQLSWDDLD